MTAAPVLVLTALPEEARPLRRSLRDRSDVVVAVTGDGAPRARRSAAALLERHRPRLVVVAGVAGALGPGLDAGAVRLIREVREPGGAVWRPDPALLDRARVAGLGEDVLVSAPRLACTREERSRTRRDAGVTGPGAGLVDLETAACVAGAQQARVPWLAVRAISDGVDDGLPPWLEEARTPAGAVSRWTVAAGALRRPTRIPGLVRLARRVRMASRALARALPGVVSAVAPVGAREEPVREGGG